MKIDFSRISADATARAESLLQQWLPDGHRDGREWVARNPNRDDKTPGSFRINLQTGVWADFAEPNAKGDMIDLYAYLNHMSTKDAAPAVAAACGHAIESPASKSTEDQWERINVVPADAPELPDVRALPPVSGSTEWRRYPIIASWPHHHADGTLAGYVVRYETPKGKETPALTLWRDRITGNLKWRFRGFKSPAPLCGTPLLARINAPIIIVEGQKCQEILQHVIDENHGVSVALTWPGGAQAVKKAEWKQIKGRRVAIWPDNDEPGQTAADYIAGVLIRQGCDVRMLPLRPDKEKGWDVADAIVRDGWTWEMVLSFVKSGCSIAGGCSRSSELAGALQPSQPECQLLETQPHSGSCQSTANYSDTPLTSNSSTHRASQEPFRILGHNHCEYYFLPRGSKQVVALTPDKLNKSWLKSIAPLQWWETTYPGERGAAWDSAADYLIRSCERTGNYDPTRISSRGATRDGGRVVVSLGDRLMIDGKPQPLESYDGRHIYESGTAIEQPDCDPLPTAGANELLQICKSLHWQRPISAYYMAGWITSAVVCGALHWRPHIWITGPRGCGKSWVLEEIVNRCLGGFAVFAQGSGVSEPGIRQRLGRDSLAVIVDEAEADTERSGDKLQAIIELARQASSDSSGLTIKGGANGKSVAYKIRSSFCFGSISEQLTRAADQSRVSVCSLRIPRELTQEQRGEAFRALQARVYGKLTEEYCQQLRARVMRNAAVIIKNSEVFAAAGAEILGSQRSGDQVGAMLAGAYSLVSDSEISPERARDWLRSQDLSEEISTQDDGDAAGCLSMILQAQIRVDGGRQYSVAELLCNACGKTELPGGDKIDTSLDMDAASRLLLRHGIRYRRGDGWGSVLISDSHRDVAGFLRGTPYARQWKNYLSRIAGAKKIPAATFNGETHRAVEITFAEMFPGWV